MQTPPGKRITRERYAYADYLKRARRAQQTLRRHFYLSEPVIAQGDLLKYKSYHKEDLVEKARLLYERLVESGDLRKGESLRVLDVGCGYGVFLKELKETLLQRHGISVEAVGVSLSPLGRQFTGSKSLGKVPDGEPYFPKGVSLKIAFMEKLPKDWAGRFHLVVSTRAVQYAYDKLKAVEEMRRVLHEGGKASVDLGPAGLIKGVYPHHWQEHGYNFSAAHWDFPLIKFTKQAERLPFAVKVAFVEMGGNIRTEYSARK